MSYLLKLIYRICAATGLIKISLCALKIFAIFPRLREMKDYERFWLPMQLIEYIISA